MLLSEDHRAVQDAVRHFVQAEIAPHAAAWDKAHTFPAEALRGQKQFDFISEFSSKFTVRVLFAVLGLPLGGLWAPPAAG